MTKQCLTKQMLENAIDANSKAKQLKLQASDGLFVCPVLFCEHGTYFSKPGCRKDVNRKYGWYYFFKEQPEMATSIT